jgi:hypothetical protein
MNLREILGKRKSVIKAIKFVEQMSTDVTVVVAFETLLDSAGAVI